MHSLTNTGSGGQRATHTIQIHPNKEATQHCGKDIFISTLQQLKEQNRTEEKMVLKIQSKGTRGGEHVSMKRERYFKWHSMNLRH